MAGDWLVAVCPDCHQNVTLNQGPANQNVLEILFEENVPNQKAIVYEPYTHQSRGEPLLFDLIRCRRNALYEAPFDFPIFCPLDLIEKCDKKLGDLNLDLKMKT